MKNKPILLLDFDGVIHSYEKGWQDGIIYGTVTEGFWEWVKEAQYIFSLYIYSSRCKDPNMTIEMSHWLIDNWKSYCAEKSILAPIPEIKLAHEKPAAFITIDDRCITFAGDWRDPALAPATLLQFKPWNQVTKPEVS